MNKDLVIAGVIVMDDVVDFRNIQTTSSKISHNQYTRLSLSELVQSISTLLHVHLTINSKTIVKLSDQSEQIIDVEPGGDEDNNLFLLDDIAK
jgi:hypothetical protein